MNFQIAYYTMKEIFQQNPSKSDEERITLFRSLYPIRLKEYQSRKMSKKDVKQLNKAYQESLEELSDRDFYHLYGDRYNGYDGVDGYDN